MIVNDSKGRNKNNYNFVRDYTLRCNADHYYMKFLNSVRNGTVKEDGTNEFFSIIDKFVLEDSDNQFHITVEPETFLYRARIVKTEQLYAGIGGFVQGSGRRRKTIGFDEANSREAPLGVGNPGRNNIAGVSYLYLANRPETACAEVKPVVGDIISLASFKISKSLRLIDFSDDKIFSNKDSIDMNVSLVALFTRIMRQYFLPVTDSDEYKITQIITDHIRKSGIDGIVYKSFFDEKGKNYTVFNSNRKAIEFVDSRLLTLQSERRTFIDFNEEKVINAKSIGKATYEDEQAKLILDRINNGCRIL